jgi:hypothetical protein
MILRITTDLQTLRTLWPCCSQCDRLTLIYHHVSVLGMRLYRIELYLLQDVQGGKVNILGCHSISHSKQKKYICTFPIPNGFQDRAISLYRQACPHTSWKVH